jgi:hypothetical protein
VERKLRKRRLNTRKVKENKENKAEDKDNFYY